MTSLVLRKLITFIGQGSFFWGAGVLLFSINQVYSQIGGEASVEDIRDIMVKRPPTSIVPVLLSITVLIGSLIMGVFAIKRLLFRQNEISGPPPEFVARRRLNQISAQIEELTPNKASLEASEAVKDFLTTQYKDPIRFETAEEYLSRISQLQAANSAKLPPFLTEEVRSFMIISQELKFAQLREAKSRIPALVEQAAKIIETAVREKVRKKN